MAKSGLFKSKILKVSGILNSKDNVIEVEGEALPIKELLEGFDGYNIQINLVNEYNNENPTEEDITSDLGKFDK